MLDRRAGRCSSATRRSRNSPSRRNWRRSRSSRRRWRANSAQRRASRCSRTPRSAIRRWSARKKSATAVSILDRREDIDFEYEGEMNVDVALNPDMRELYPFSRLSEPANVLVMPALHSASIATEPADHGRRRDGDRPGAHGALLPDPDRAAGRHGVGHRHLRDGGGVSGQRARRQENGLGRGRRHRRSRLLLGLPPPLERRERNGDDANPRREDEHFGEAFGLGE